MRNQCPCGSKKRYKNCCQLVHNDHTQAKTPEQLMRARYSAYSLGLTDFIINTYTPDVATNIHRSEIEQGTELHWIKLSLKSSGITSPNDGFVHFKALYKEDGDTFFLEEVSYFKKHNDKWFYVNGEFPNK